MRGWTRLGCEGPSFTDNADLSALGCSFIPAAAAHPQAAPPTTGAPLQLDWRHCWRTGPGVARRSKADTRKPEKEVFLAGTERRGGGGSNWSLSSPLKQHTQHCAPLFSSQSVIHSTSFPSILLKVVTHNLCIYQFGFILSLVTSLVLGKTYNPNDLSQFTSTAAMAEI